MCGCGGRKRRKKSLILRAKKLFRKFKTDCTNKFQNKTCQRKRSAPPSSQRTPVIRIPRERNSPRRPISPQGSNVRRPNVAQPSVANVPQSNTPQSNTPDVPQSDVPQTNTPQPNTPEVPQSNTPNAPQPNTPNEPKPNVP